MLGEKIGHDSGKVTLRRVLPSEGAPRVESSFEAAGQLLGVDYQTFGTYTSDMRPDGTLFGNGQGVIMGANGEHVSWRGQGVGRFNDDGTMSFRGCIYGYSEGATFSKLNNVALCYEHEIAADGTVKNQLWEWR